MTTKHTIEIEFEVGTIKEMGYGGLKQGWIDAEDKGQKLSFTAGAGVGSALLEASVSDPEEGDYLVAHADIRPVATAIWRILQAAVAADQHTRLSQEIENGDQDPGDGSSSPAGG